MSETESGLDWDDGEVTAVDGVAKLPMLDMREADRTEREERSRKPTVRMRPVKAAS